MKNYDQLTLSQRYTISVLLQENKSQKYIAEQVGVCKSTISRELHRHSIGGKYAAEEAHRRCCYKKRHRKPYKLDAAMTASIESGLKADWSPEQIVGEARATGGQMVSHETIYRFVYKQQKKVKQQQQQQDNEWWLTCLRSKQKKRKKRKNTYENRQIDAQKPVKAPKVSIEERPDIINKKERIGDCEIDTIIGKNHQGAIMTLVERKTKHTTIVKLPNKTQEAVTNALVKISPQLPYTITSITADNGTEFADYNNVKQLLNCQFYFAHPYSSWERGLNENTNGLIRQYIPKKTDFKDVDDDQIQKIQEKINNRPRKTLNFYSPNQIFEKNIFFLTGCT